MLLCWKGVFRIHQNNFPMKMRLHVCSTLLFVFAQLNFCAAQNTSDTIPNKTYQSGKCQLSIFFSPDYCNQKYKGVRYENAASLNAYNQQIADTFNSITNSGIGHSVGLEVLCPFNKKVSLLTGIYFALRTKRYNGFVYQNGIYYDNTVFHLTNYKKEQSSFLQIPIAINYYFSPNSKKKIRLDCFAGSLLSINCNKYNIGTLRWWDAFQPPPTTADGFVLQKMDAFSILYIGFLIGGKVNYQLNNHFAFNLAPTFKYFPFVFGNIMKGYYGRETYETPWSIGCEIGMTYSFGKN